jgi:hypothetical protein
MNVTSPLKLEFRPYRVYQTKVQKNCARPEFDTLNSIGFFPFFESQFYRKIETQLQGSLIRNYAHRNVLI